MEEKRFTIGTDPEFFLKDKNGKFLSAIPFINGTKQRPEELESGGSLQYDNVAVEFSTPPANNGSDLVEKVRNTFKDIRKKIPAECTLEVQPSANFDEDQLDCDEARAFGCDPDYCAWELMENEAPRGAESTLRTCGGHVHVGKADGDGNDFLLDPYGKINTVRMMDAVHGIISVVLDNSEAAVIRRKLYGKAGCHRPVIKEAGGLYDGVEYRVLSNFWFKSPQLVMLIDSLTHDVLRIIREMDYLQLLTDIGEERIREIINKGVVEDAHKVLEDFIKPLLSKDSLHYLDECTANIKNYDFNKEWEMEA
jgi:hypothetical protein